MDDDDVVVLDSDDDEPQTVAACAATATMSIVTGRPLDLNVLGLVPRGLAQPQPQPLFSAQPKKGNGNLDSNQLRVPLNRIPVAGARHKHHSHHSTHQSHTRPVPTTTIQQPIRYSIYNEPIRVPDRAQKMRSCPKPSKQHLSLIHACNMQRSQIRNSPDATDLTPIAFDADWRENVEKVDLRVAPVDSYVSDARLNSYHFDAVGPAVPNAVKRKKMPWLRFKCMMEGCRRIINGDYHFVIHLWTHMATYRACPDDTVCEEAIPHDSPFEREHKKISHSYTDVDKLARCPECLTRFHRPIQMQVHYTRVHSTCNNAMQQSTCTICERDVSGGREGLRKHLLIHSQQDAPYNCRVCKFRTTLRSKMFVHYVTAHGHTGTLMCPFCMHTHVIPTERLQRSLFYLKKFVDHMRSHRDNKRVTCNMCACSFFHVESLRRHEMDHMQIPNDWKIERDKPATLDITSNWELKKEACEECGVMPSPLLKRVEKCMACSEKVFWKKIKDREASLVGKPNYAEDTVGSPIPAPLGARFICRCGLSTVNRKKIMSHFERTEHFFKIVEEKVASDVDPLLVLPDLIEESKAFKQAELFAQAFKHDDIGACSRAALKRQFVLDQEYLEQIKEMQKATSGTSPKTVMASVEFVGNMKMMDELDFVVVCDEADIPEDTDGELERRCAAALLKRMNEGTLTESDADETESEVNDEEEESDDEDSYFVELRRVKFLRDEAMNESSDSSSCSSSLDSVEEDNRNENDDSSDDEPIPLRCMTPDESAEELSSQGSSPSD